MFDFGKVKDIADVIKDDMNDPRSEPSLLVSKILYPLTGSCDERYQKRLVEKHGNGYSIRDASRVSAYANMVLYPLGYAGAAFLTIMHYIPVPEAALLGAIGAGTLGLVHATFEGIDRSDKFEKGIHKAGFFGKIYSAFANYFNSVLDRVNGVNGKYRSYSRKSDVIHTKYRVLNERKQAAKNMGYDNTYRKNIFKIFTPEKRRITYDDGNIDHSRPDTLPKVIEVPPVNGTIYLGDPSTLRQIGDGKTGSDGTSS